MTFLRLTTLPPHPFVARHLVPDGKWHQATSSSVRVVVSSASPRLTNDCMTEHHTRLVLFYFSWLIRDIKRSFKPNFVLQRSALSQTKVYLMIWCRPEAADQVRMDTSGDALRHKLNAVIATAYSGSALKHAVPGLCSGHSASTPRGEDEEGEHAPLQTGAGSPTFSAGAHNDASSNNESMTIPQNVSTRQLNGAPSPVAVSINTNGGLMRNECCLGVDGADGSTTGI